MKTWLVLIRKELRQHVLAMVGLLLLCLLGYLNVLGYAFSKQATAAPLYGLRLFLIFYMPLTALLLAGRLVVGEYTAGTQVFLESLPLARLTMVTVKYLLGLVLMVGVAGAALLMAVSLSSLSPDGRQLLIIISRGIVYIWTLYSFCFLGGFLGRYRFYFYLFSVLGLSLLASYTDFDISRWGPFALLDSTLAFERVEFPWGALGSSAALALAFSAGAFALALVREGSVAALTARKMSSRERIAFTMLILSFLAALGYLEDRSTPQPFQLLVGSSAQEGAAKVSVLTALEPEETDEVMARQWSRELEAMGRYLGLAEVPQVFIVERTDLDPDLFEQGAIQNASGVLARAHITHPDFRRVSFTAWLLRRLLLDSSQKRLAAEEYAWVLDGFPLYWLEMRSEADQATLMLRALWAASEGMQRIHLQRWLTLRERLGQEVAAGLAYSALVALRQRCGAEGLQEFLGRVLATPVPRDIRALWRARPTRPAQALRDVCGITLDDLLVDWNNLLESNRVQSASALSSLPRLEMELEEEEFSELSRGLHYRLSVSPQPAQPLFVEIRYARLQGLEMRKDRPDLELQTVRYPAQSQGALPGTYTPGERVYAAALLHVPLLGCSVVSGWRVLEVD